VAPTGDVAAGAGVAEDVAAAAPLAAATPSNPGSSGGLALVVGLLIVGIVVGPPLVVRAFNRGGAK
jgi:hypothetical protein